MNKLLSIKKSLQNKGFTLVELLISIMIISILTGIILAVINPLGIRQKARDSQRSSDIQKIKVALEGYFTDNRGYPRSDTWTLISPTASGTVPTALSAYVTPLPGDPNGSTGTNPCVASGAGYLYRAPASGAATVAPTYDLTANVELAASAATMACPSSICSSGGGNCIAVAGPGGFSTPAATYTYSGCVGGFAGFVSTVNCPLLVTGGTLKTWGSTCTTVGSIANCVYSGCPVNSAGCGAPTSPTQVSSWNCRCQ